MFLFKYLVENIPQMKLIVNYSNLCLSREGEVKNSNGHAPRKLPEQAAYLDLLCAVFKSPMIDLTQTITPSARRGQRPAA